MLIYAQACCEDAVTTVGHIILLHIWLPDGVPKRRLERPCICAANSSI